ncbi:MAG: hypothetical protein JJU16_00660 [Alkalibacterium sp.]|nr:hypothetical protein [Alkalibacterium sp.]
MTKYSKLFSILTICLLTLVGFTFYQAQAESVRPKVELVTEEGQAEELDLLYFLGNVHGYDSYRNNYNTTFEYRNGEMHYFDDLSILQKVDFNFTPRMNRYTEDYRSFMRGKSRQTDHYTETDEYLLYTGMHSDVNWRQFNDNSLTISLLDKETNEETAQEVHLTGGSYQSVIAAYLDYPSLTLVTQALDEDSTNNWLIYSYDLENPQDEIAPVINSKHTLGSPTIQLSDSQSKTGRYLSFRTLEPGETDEYDYVLNHTTSGYYVYDTVTEELKEVPSFEEGETVVLTEAETILVGNDLEDDIVWSEWNFEDDSLTEQGTASMVTPTIGRVQVHYYDYTFNQGLQLINGRIYAFEEDYVEDMSRPLFQVIDLDSFDTVFSGYIGVETNLDTSQAELVVYEYSLDYLLN